MATERSSALPTQGGFLERGEVLFCQAGLKRAFSYLTPRACTKIRVRAVSCSALAGFCLNSRYRVRGSCEQSLGLFLSQKRFPLVLLALPLFSFLFLVPPVSFPVPPAFSL